MRDDTPYHARPPGEVARERACMEAVFRQAAPVDLIFEAFGGTAVTGQVLRAAFPHARIIACDTDAQCVDTYNAVMGGGCEHAPAQHSAALLRPPRRWGASLDYNRFTLLDLTSRSGWKRELLQLVAARQPTWLQLTDSACRYLHLNHRSYDLPRPDLEDYITVLTSVIRARFGMGLVTWSSHSAAAYILFGR